MSTAIIVVDIFVFNQIFNSKAITCKKNTNRVQYACMILASMQNEKIKLLKKLMADKSLVFFDNPKLVDEAYNAGHNIIYLIKKEGYVGKTDYGGEVVEVTENVFKIFSSTVNSQGLIGVVEFKNLHLQKPSCNFLVLDGLQDPGNVGTLFRSALGANFLDVYLLDCVKANNDKVIRSSMGAVFKLKIYQTTRQDFISEFKKWNLPLYVCNMSGENIFDTKVTQKVGVAVGNEGNGISLEIKNIASNIVKIPMENNLESLNAGVSGSIVMYCIQNQKKY